MTDSAPIMISMTYDPRCETPRFAWRNICFVFADFGPRRRPKRNGLRTRCVRADSSSRGAQRRGDPGDEARCLMIPGLLHRHTPSKRASPDALWLLAMTI